MFRISTLHTLFEGNQIFFLLKYFHVLGAICCGETIEEAFYYAYHLVLACDTQLKMVPLGIDNLIMIDEPTRYSCNNITEFKFQTKLK